MKYHNDQRDHHCALCDMAFHELKTLKTHLSKIHGIEKPKGTGLYTRLKSDKVIYIRCRHIDNLHLSMYERINFTVYRGYIIP